MTPVRDLRVWLCAAATLPIVVLTGACQPQNLSQGGNATPTGNAQSATTEASPSTSGGLFGIAGGATRCHSEQLGISVVGDPNGGAAGQYGIRILFTNTSTTTCTMYGYPGVSFLTTANGQQVNDAATRAANATENAVTVAPGTSAYATVRLTQVGNFPQANCQPVVVSTVRVYPPDETVAKYATTDQRLCSVAGAGVPVVYPVTSGS